MRCGFLKLVLTTSLVVFSSFANANESFVFRQLLLGVSGKEYYGMSQDQINKSIAEKEKLNQIEQDKAMCLEERTWVDEVTKIRYVNEDRYRTKYKDETYEKTWPSEYSGYIDGHSQGGSYFWSIDERNGATILKYGSKGCSITGSMTDKRSTSWVCNSATFKRGASVISDYPYVHYKISMITTETRSVPYQEAYVVKVPEEYEVSEVIKSENYDYCINNGYETKN